MAAAAFAVDTPVDEPCGREYSSGKEIADMWQALRLDCQKLS